MHWTRHRDANIMFIHPRLIGCPRVGYFASKSRKSGCRRVLVTAVEHGLMKSLNRDWRWLKVRFAQTERDDIIACEVKHLADACRLNTQDSVAECSHSITYRGGSFQVKGEEGHSSLLLFRLFGNQNAVDSLCHFNIRSNSSLNGFVRVVWERT